MGVPRVQVGGAHHRETDECIYGVINGRKARLGRGKDKDSARQCQTVPTGQEQCQTVP